MRHTILIGALILASSPAVNAVNLRVREGRPIADGVYVNGHGPYRFLVDTGTNVNLIDTNLAQAIGLTVAFQVDLTTATGKLPVPESDGNEVVLDAVKVDRQKFLYSELEAIHNFWPDVQGVLGQSFLSQFDYTLDLRGKRLVFGKQQGPDRRGVPLRMINGRLAVATSLGDLIVDSGSAQLVLFGVEPDIGLGGKREWRTVAGSQPVGMLSNKSLVIGGRTIWRGNAVAIPNRSEPGVDGLLPLSFFKAIYVCNSDGYAIFE
jgi:hypothetical protein